MKWRIPSWAFLLWMAALSLAFVALALHAGWLYSEFWLLAPFALIAVFLLYVLLAAPALAIVVARGRVGVACLVFVLGVALPATLVFVPEARSRARFYVERPAFDAVAELARQGRLDSDEYYGARLPGELCFVSATCTVVTWEDGALFVPDWVGIPDDAVGYAHFTGAPGGPYDGFGMMICPRFELADGWWWLDACP
ncbi:hypothetical protein [Nonomuraea sp. NPDC049400]|uniref:hypothetical protein n=1 Tax=Nonomuraea sp. NPDC049400 TaxID=3364352 RepID=UPI00378B87C6